MNFHIKIFIWVLCPLIFPFHELCSEEGKAFDHPNLTMAPIILQLNMKADIIIVGRDIDPPVPHENFTLDTIEIERIICSVWNKEEINQKLDVNGRIRRLSVVQKEPFSDGSAVFFQNGRYLCWLKQIQLPEKNKIDADLNPLAYYEPVQGVNKYSAMVPGIVLISPHVRELMGEKAWERGRRLFGEEYEEMMARGPIEEIMGITNPEEIIEATSKFSRFMMKVQDYNDELGILTESENPQYSGIASYLLKLGNSAKRFRYVNDMAFMPIPETESGLPEEKN
jgi:hypothetical protein